MKQAVCRLCRREQTKLFLKGERCFSPKCSYTRRPFPPGMAGQSRKGKPSDYSRQLRAKQKAKAIYGVSETQFKKYYREAAKTKGKTGETLLQILERRIDNVVYCLGLAPSRQAARQLVSHGKILVNDKAINISSYLVKEKNVIAVVDKKIKISKKKEIPIWLKLDSKNLVGKVVKLPERKEMDADIDEQLIVEYYSR